MAALTSLTPTRIRALLDARGIRPSRALGQHFLADPNTARRIVRVAGVEPGDRVLEIGPGVGSLTLALLDAGAEVVALELDRRVLTVLAEVVGDRVELVHGDALTADLGALAPPGRRPWRVVSNLPYNVATPVVMRLLHHAPQIASLLVMVQREVGERWTAPPGTKTFGALSVRVAYFATATTAGAVPASVFVPPPKVESVLVRLDRHRRPPVSVPSTDELFALLRAGFAHRRKTLRRSLRPLLGERTEVTLAAAGIPAEARAETLDLSRWAALARAAA